ncbi:GNAT family N-acetyltransferase [Tianweitania sediminis]|uniref:N-acetyltransferase n=1 Tax=Tianweitania sediminis TaxID=1502156 RepID=A0A8J7RIF5_9HYPH|nr:GNAT family N-acetyltransferase [Tianweitania sediminis]MBP0437796.1 N-acetyltransferase [Tianweitania sediminis]HEV7416447.1 GNAT family N-acetyltransferase [Tianweitania sediminis]
MITIRPALETDMPAVTTIYRHSVEHGTATYELEAPDETEMLARFRSLRGAEYPYLVALDEAGEILGYAYAGPFRARPAYRFFAENSVYLAPHAQRKGVGRLLMQALIEACEKLGFRQIVAVIGDGSPSSASVKLHRALGFQMCGTMIGSGFKHERWLDTVLMQLPLNGGTSSPPDPDSMPERRYRASL